jgi:hypothetical protein
MIFGFIPFCPCEEPSIEFAPLDFLDLEKYLHEEILSSIKSLNDIDPNHVYEIDPTSDNLYWYHLGQYNALRRAKFYIQCKVTQGRPK